MDLLRNSQFDWNQLNSTRLNSILSMNWIELIKNMWVCESNWVELDYFEEVYELNWIELDQNFDYEGIELNWVENIFPSSTNWVDSSWIFCRWIELNWVPFFGEFPNSVCIQGFFSFWISVRLYLRWFDVLFQALQSKSRLIQDFLRKSTPYRKIPLF
jgi:hypothetical protein